MNQEYSEKAPQDQEIICEEEIHSTIEGGGIENTPAGDRNNLKKIFILVICAIGLIIIIAILLEPSAEQEVIEEQTQQSEIQRQAFIEEKEADYFPQTLEQKEEAYVYMCYYLAVECVNISTREKQVYSVEWQQLSYTEQARIIEQYHLQANRRTIEEIFPVEVAEEPRISGITPTTANESTDDGRTAELGITVEVEQRAENAPSLPLGNSVYEQQNQQRQKQAFLEQQNQRQRTTVLDEQVEYPLSQNEIKAGTIITFNTLTKINSDLPSVFLGSIAENIYATNGNNLLIPKGSKIICRYDSNIAWGQERILATAERIIRPDGTSINIPGMIVISETGESGLTGTVETHIKELLTAIALVSALDTGKIIIDSTILAGIAAIPGLQGIAEVLKQDNLSDETFEKISETLTERYLSKQPTIIVEQGTQAAIFLDKDIILTPYRERKL